MDKDLEMLMQVRIVAMIVVLCFFLMFLFVPETFWDRTPRPSSKSRFESLSGLFHVSKSHVASTTNVGPSGSRTPAIRTTEGLETASIQEKTEPKKTRNVEFADKSGSMCEDVTADDPATLEKGPQMPSNLPALAFSDVDAFGNVVGSEDPDHLQTSAASPNIKDPTSDEPSGNPTWPVSFHVSPPSPENERDYHLSSSTPNFIRSESVMTDHMSINERSSAKPELQRYTTLLRNQPAKSFKQTLKPWNGRLRHENWFLVALRPFILFAYPAILWSTLVYSLSIGWLIVLSESVSTVYRNKETYNFSPLGTGLVYISPFIGGVLGTAVAGKVSDIIVRFMSRRNDGIYEPEFRLVMAIPVAVSTCIGLMGFGWSAAEKDKWIVPTVFFGIISFGCSLGSTTAITFAVDSYRQYAGEALVTLNFSKSESRSSSQFDLLPHTRVPED